MESLADELYGSPANPLQCLAILYKGHFHSPATESQGTLLLILFFLQLFYQGSLCCSVIYLYIASTEYAPLCMVTTFSSTMTWQWDSITDCEMTDPLRDVTCIGLRKDGAGCNNYVSQNDQKSAYHQLELLAVKTKDPSFLHWRLERIATLELCKRWHQDQKTTVAEKWHRAACSDVLSQSPSTRICGIAVRERDNPIDLTLPATSPTSTASGDLYEMTGNLRENQIPFDVSPAKPVSVTFQTTPNCVKVCTIRHGCDVSALYCDICHETSTEETIHLKCEVCRHGIHLGCTEDWLKTVTPEADSSALSGKITINAIPSTRINPTDQLLVKLTELLILCVLERLRAPEINPAVAL